MIYSVAVSQAGPVVDVVHVVRGNRGRRRRGGQPTSPRRRRAACFRKQKSIDNVILILMMSCQHVINTTHRRLALTVTMASRPMKICFPLN